MLKDDICVLRYSRITVKTIRDARCVVVTPSDTEIGQRSLRCKTKTKDISVHSGVVRSCIHIGIHGCVRKNQDELNESS